MAWRRLGKSTTGQICKNWLSKFFEKKTTFYLQKSRPCGIIYCRTREVTGSLAECLSNKGIPTKAYHAGLKDKERAGVQDEWMTGKIPVITATISFGMGVDKASVRYTFNPTRYVLL